LEQESEAAIRIAEKAGDGLLIYAGHGFQSIAQSRLGKHAAAFESMTRSQALGEKLGQNLIFGDWFAAAGAEIALNAVQIDNALELAEQAAARGQQMGGLYSQGLAHRVWGQALAAHQPPRSAEAEKHFAESLRLFEAGQARLEAARTRLAWGKMLRERGEPDAARQELAQAAAQFDRSGLTRELEEARTLTPKESVQD
jgi:tetratricopeptide (TPR) repeat protein